MEAIVAGFTVAPSSVHEGSSSSSASVHPREEASALPALGQSQHRRQWYQPVFYHLNVSIFQEAARSMRDEGCVGAMVLVTFWIFACLIVIMGFYGSSNLELGPNSSFLLHPNPFFVQSIKVKELQESNDRLVLYGFDELPSLDVKVKWSETHAAFVGPGDLKEWQYFLNKGSKVHISYSVQRPSSAALSLAIAEGRASLFDWMEDPSNPNKTLSWNIIHGSGIVEQEISGPETYFIALKNLNFEEVEAKLNFTIEALTYNATQANYKCSLSQQQLCTYSLPFMGNVAVITSPGPEPGKDNYIWRIQLRYGHRWISYFVGSAAVAVLFIVVMRICFTFQIAGEFGPRFQDGRSISERAPLLSQKDDDNSSWGSYESLSNDEDELYESLSPDGKQIIQGDGTGTQDKRRLCILCTDAFRDCFFLPCGHCAACFTCGRRVFEEGGKCPVCHHIMKKVRRIFSV